MKITKIQAIEILDSRGNPTVQTTVWSGEVYAKASVPSGASTGIHEALELRDGDKSKFKGQGVLKACKNINTKISNVLVGMSANDQEAVDKAMMELDGTENKSKLGANAILSVSLATARLGSKLEKLELFEYLAKKYGYEKKTLPTPLFNVINGGKHADNGLDIQEFFIIPLKGSFSNKLRISTEVFHTLKTQLETKKLTSAVGDEGGFAPKLTNNEEAFKLLEVAIKSAGYKLGNEFSLGIDAASSEFFNSKTGTYELKASNISAKPSNIFQTYKKWITKYPILAIEDGCAEDDFLGWKFLTQNLGSEVLLIGDDLFVTNPVRIQMGITQKIANAVLIKLNQIGTLTETISAVKLAQKHNYKVVVSHRSGETCDDFIADLAVAVNAEYIKAGAPSRGERVAKYNRLLEIENLISAK